MMNSKILLLVLLTIFARLGGYAQCVNPPNCILNPGIDGSGTAWGNPVGTTLPNWWVLSGTPVYAQGVLSSNGFRLVNGDGMGTCYNFQAGRTYKVCIYAYTTNGQNGTVTLEANNGGGGNQILGNIVVTQHGIQPVGYSTGMFTVNPGGFNQLRVYVNTANTSVLVDDVCVIEVPTVTATPSPINFCGSARLTASANNIGNMNISWSPSTGLSATTGATVTARPCTTTTYTCTYTSRCSPMYSCNNSNNNTVQVTVTVQPNGSIINNSASIPCGGVIDLQYAAGSPCPGATYKWIGPKGNVLSTGTSVYMPGSSSTDQGTYKLIITNSQGCIDSSLKTTVTMVGCCDIKADFDIIGCNPVRFANTTTSNGNPVIQGEWYWTLGDGTTSTLRNPSHLYITKMGPNTVCMNVVYQGQSTCCGKICKDFNICDFPPCEVRAAFDYKVMNPGTNSVQFMDKSAGSGSACGWTWKVNGTVQSTAQNPLLTLSPGTYTICLDAVHCMGGTTCNEEWCEDIIIP